ncbi:MAG: FAD-dependent oxidoreductase [Alphaproteobacteria bacterium]|nr:FAD-dependent oxidoreductase [Alphaproteobacteria bacterium]MDA8009369.1 FAD-dependent oxidoreductase [Alphaproteobacteria bacterium]
MTRDARYDVLFEPVTIGPKVAKNRFYQVPHCNGMGYRDVSAGAEMRRVKAEGGWGVVCTEQIEVHPTSDITPYVELRLWHDDDIPALARIADKIHEGGALAGAELAHNGANSPNLYSRMPPIGPAHMPVITFTPEQQQARRAGKKDIADLRRWHRDAAIRAKRAGYDIVYVYAAHGLGFIHYFLSREYNDRNDEYGGSLENRCRILREVLEDTKDAVGADCAIACRVSMDELRGKAGFEREEMEEIISLVAEIPDLWDVTISGWHNDSRTSRFAEEGHEEPYIANVKKLTTKPVVGVGRYTSPDRMVSLVQKGVLDFIGAARPSIADPFLPKKIEEGRLEDIRECIGCNICVSGDITSSPIKCTQNPAMGEEWRRGWHPERHRAAGSDKSVLVVGAGPAGLEATQTLGKRGYSVILAEAGTELGGRVVRESKLPGLSAWIRVRDWREQQIRQMTNVEIYFDSALDADSILEFGFPRVAFATGSRWRDDGVGRGSRAPMEVTDGGRVVGVEALLRGELPSRDEVKSVVVWDSDHYYMGGVLAELLAEAGFSVTYVTSETSASVWMRNTLEHAFVQASLLNKGVEIRAGLSLVSLAGGAVKFACVYTGREHVLEADALVPVTMRLPEDAVYRALLERRGEWADKGVEDVVAIGDAFAPGTIAHAVHAGRLYGEDMDAAPLSEGELPFRMERAALTSA